MKQPCVYLLASSRNGVLYIGVTSDLTHRMAEHSQGLIAGFTRRYGVKHLVYYECTRRWTRRSRTKSGSRNGGARGRSGLSKA